jgi:Methyltransferase domain
MNDKYQILQGTPYSQYAIPVEYLPSRDFRPRWGYSQPRIRALDDWFRKHCLAYHSFLAEMRGHIDTLREIPLVFDPQLLPTPAWFEVPYAPVDAVALYSMIRKHRPACFLEIGSGISTCFAYRAVKDAGLQTEIISIDPHPRAEIDSICDLIVREGLELCDLAVFDRLQKGDIVFFDGSHRSFMNSDVTVFMIDVLPRLKPGVLVHIHDIMLPWDYPDSFKNWYWNEQYLLALYLMGNKSRIDPLLPTAFICRDREFEDFFSIPLIDFGERNDGWRGGGAMWFTHLS